MPIDYSDHAEVLLALGRDQDADHGRREKVREINRFLNDPNGHWEDDVFNAADGKPRYQFDKCNPVVDDIAGEMEQSDFAIRVRPAGGDSTVEIAKVRSGLIRNIENLSNAQHVYNAAGRAMVATGMDGWEVVQDWVDGDDFDQELLIRKLNNYVDRVWFDCGAETQTQEDGNHVTILSALTPQEYKDKWPDGSGVSVGNDATQAHRRNVKDNIIVGRIQWKKRFQREIVRMTNGKVYDVDDNFEKVADDLKDIGITEDRRRTRDSWKIMSRIFDGSKWLGEAQETVFKSLPVAPVFANFSIIENALMYKGAVEPLMDSQRVYDYAKSRDIEEGALAARSKLMITRDQAKHDMESLETMNTNADPAQFWTFVAGQPPPFMMNGAQTNQGLQITAQGALRDIETTAGIFGPSRGEDQGIRAGVAIEKLQNKADSSKIKYFTSMEIAICQTGKILNEAMPAVYDTQRQVRILGEDGTEETVTLNEKVFDKEAQQEVTLNDLQAGTYDQVCDVGQPFKNRQDETVESILKLAALDPEFLSLSRDIILKNIDAPGVDLMQERVRGSMVRNGGIPESQLTDDEKKVVSQIQQQKPPVDPALEILAAQQESEQAEGQSRIDERTRKLELEELKFELKTRESEQKLSNEQFANELKANDQKWQQVMDTMNQIPTQAQVLKMIREGAGVDTIVGPGIPANFKTQSDIVTGAQGEVEDVLPELQP
jgi:hypothetical protein